MAFDPADLFSKELVRKDWLKLSKAELCKVAEFQEIDMDPNKKKLEIIDYIIKQLSLTGSETDDLKTKIELAKLETKVELAKIEQQGQYERAKLEVEREKIKSTDTQYQRTHEARFNVSSCLKLMPKFNTDDVEVFFYAFEKIASELQWPEGKWPILVQSVFIGRAQEAYVALDPAQSTAYKVIKDVVLRAYEGHRQMFRSLRRKPGETFLDLARQQEAVYERRLKGSDTFTFKELKELMLLEQFKSSIPGHIEIYLNAQEVGDLRKAAMLADSYELTQKEVVPRERPGVARRWPAEQSRPTEDRDVGYRSSSDKSYRGNLRSSRSPPWRDSREIREVICYHCRKPGHMKSSCPARREKYHPGSETNRIPKSVGLINTKTQVANVMTQVGTTPGIFNGFVSTGALSLSAGEPEVTVTILRDTGAAQSVLLAGVVELSTQTATVNGAVKKPRG